MKVMLLNSLDGLRGRRRGLRAAEPTLEAAKAEAFDRFTARLEKVDEALDDLVTAAESASIPIADYDALTARYEALDQQIGSRIHTFNDGTNTVGALRAWESGNASVLSTADAWVADVRRIVGDERSRRNLKIGLLTVGAILLLGGGAYVINKRYG